MKQFTLLTLIVLVMGCMSCDSGYEPYNPTNSTTNSEVEPVAEFTYTITQPMTVIFKNESSNASAYHWDFGDGITSTRQHPVHKYKKKGVYKVTLKASHNGKSRVREANVTVENPTCIYFAGVTYDKLAVENEYVKFKLVDDDLFTTVWYNSEYTLVSSANMPFKFELPKPVLMNGLHEDDYYVINVYYNTKKSGDGTRLAGFKFYTSDIYDGYPETLQWKETEGNQISCHFMYE